MLLTQTSSMLDNPEPLELAEIPVPAPGNGQVLLRVAACGVCHTELDEIEGRTPPPRLPVVPGHEIVGVVAERGTDARRFRIGQRVGVGWIYRSTGEHDENLSEQFLATGRDVNGGYAEYFCVDERYAYPIPESFADAEAAPLLCAGAVGYRALKLAGITDGDVLGLTGFGGSGHLVLQLTKHLYPRSRVLVFARSVKERAFAAELGAAWTGDTEDEPPEAPHAIIDTTPAWRPVLAALARLRRGGRLVINAIRKENGDKDLMSGIVYEEHLWHEKELKTVANVTRSDIEQFLSLAGRMDLHPAVETYPLEQANRALADLKAGHIRGAMVLTLGSGA